MFHLELYLNQYLNIKIRPELQKYNTLITLILLLQIIQVMHMLLYLLIFLNLLMILLNEII